MINQSYKPNVILELLCIISIIGAIITSNPVFIILSIFVFIANQML